MVVGHEDQLGPARIDGYMNGPYGQTQLNKLFPSGIIAGPQNSKRLFHQC